MLQSTVRLATCVVALSLTLSAVAQPQASESPATEHVQALRKRIAELEAKPDRERTVADRLELSDAYLQVGQNTLAVKNAFLARQADFENEDTWVALVRAQIANLHEVVYAEENFQGALKKFPHSPKINELREELFFGQLKFGQPKVAVDHLVAWLHFETNRKDREQADWDHTFDTGRRLVETLVERRAPVFALTQLEQKLTKLQQDAPESISNRFDPLLKHVRDAVEKLSPAEKTVELRGGY